jgi:hypothetical protein
VSARPGVVRDEVQHSPLAKRSGPFLADQGAVMKKDLASVLPLVETEEGAAEDEVSECNVMNFLVN